MSQLTYVLNKQYKQTVLLSLIMLVVECPRVKCMNFHPSTSCLFFICQAHNILHYENFTNYFQLSMIVLLLDLILLMFDLLHHYQLLQLTMYVFIFNSLFMEHYTLYSTLYSKDRTVWFILPHPASSFLMVRMLLLYLLLCIYVCIATCSYVQVYCIIYLASQLAI